MENKTQFKKTFLKALIKDNFDKSFDQSFPCAINSNKDFNRSLTLPHNYVRKSFFHFFFLRFHVPFQKAAINLASHNENCHESRTEIQFLLSINFREKRKVSLILFFTVCVECLGLFACRVAVEC